MLDFLLYSILPFFFILGFCITIHELGHFIFAKLSKIPVEKFSIGFGPPLIRMKIGETDFRIAYFPLGGYVKMAGEDEGEIVKKEKQEKTDVPGFYDAPIWKRIAVVFFGPLFNILSAFIVLFVIIFAYGVIVTPFMKITVEESSFYERQGFVTNDSIIAVNGLRVNTWEELWEIVDQEVDNRARITVMRHDGSVHDIHARIDEDSTGIAPLVPPIAGALKQNSPADKAGMKQGDRIISIDDRSINSWSEMVDIVRTSQNTPLRFTWVHGGETMTAAITPEPFYDPIDEDTIGQIGVFMPHGRTHVSVLSAFGLSVQRTTEMIYRVLEIFYQLITRQIPARQLGGPIAIFKLSTESAQWGFEYLLGLLAIISVNLGLINLFPIPALDGGHIIIAAIEAIRHKRFSSRTRLIIQQVGYALIFLLIIFVTFNDITR